MVKHRSFGMKRPLGTTGLFLTHMRVDTNNGRMRPNSNPLPSVRSIRHAHGILPRDKTRLLFVNGYPTAATDGEVQTVPVLTISANPKYPTCNGCVFYHRPTSTSCTSAPIPFTDPSVVYDMKRRTPIGRIISRQVTTSGTKYVQLELIKMKLYKEVN